MRDEKAKSPDKSAIEEGATTEGIASPRWRARLGRLFQSRLSKLAGTVILGGTLVLAICWFYPRSIWLWTPLEHGELFASGTAVYLDDASVGAVTTTRVVDGVNFAELRLSGLTAGQKQKLKEGLVRVTGYRMAWLTSEFVDRRGPPLIDDDTVPAVSRAERENRKTMALFVSWIVPGSGVGLLWLLWRGAKRVLS